MTQQRKDGQNLTGEFRPWRIPAGWLIQIELAWLIAATLLGGYLSGLPSDNWWAWAYRTYAGGNVLGLFVLGNAAGYLLYEEVRMVLSGIYHREKVAEVKVAEAGLKTAEAELIADRAELEADRAEAEAAAAVAKAAAARAEARAARAEAIVAAQPEGEAQAAAAAREAERAAVAAWYERQQAAQRAGQSFAEPPPGYDGSGNGGGAAV